MTRLSVNVNKVALLRNSRPLEIPNVEHLARLALDAGAHGITVHPRPDARHIRPGDVGVLLKLTRERQRELNIEGNPFHDLMGVVRVSRPDQCTLVPDDPGAATSDHGWNLQRDGDRLRPVIAELKGMGVRVSLFMDAQEDAMARAHALGADRIELYTEPYARAFGTSAERAQLRRFQAAAMAAMRSGLGVNAGHDLNRGNLASFLHHVPEVLEVSIGHALVADALEFGMSKAVALYLDAVGMGGRA